MAFVFKYTDEHQLNKFDIALQTPDNDVTLLTPTTSHFRQRKRYISADDVTFQTPLTTKEHSNHRRCQFDATDKNAELPKYDVIFPAPLATKFHYSRQRHLRLGAVGTLVHIRWWEHVASAVRRFVLMSK